MKIVPIDIAHKSFKRKMMGFDSEEVSEFLSLVADEMESLIHERNKLKEVLREKELQILEYKDKDRILKDTLTTVQKMSERMKSDAERENQIILQDAHQKADMIVRDSRDSLKNVYREINEIKKIKLQFEGNLKAMLQTHLELLAKQEQYLPHIPEMARTETARPLQASGATTAHASTSEKLADRIQKEKSMGHHIDIK